MSKSLVTKVVQLLAWLASKPEIGGLQVSDSALLYVALGKRPRALSLKIPPGVIREGKVLLPDELSRLLRQLHGMIEGGLGDRRVSVVVCLPAAVAYTQSFHVPNLGEGRLAESANLNLQMLSPIPTEAAYMSSQVIGVNQDRYELLGAFAERKVVDAYRGALEQARFAPVAFEFPSLAVARLAGETIQRTAAAALVFQVSSDGLNLSIVKNGSLYFDYFRSWASIQGEAREISRALFEEVVTQEVQKVINFTLGRFKETPERVYLIAPALGGEIEKFLESRFGLAIAPLTLTSWSLTSQWYVALGSAIRGSVDRSRDIAISLAPVGSAELFYQEQVIDFVVLWRNIIAGTLLLFLVLYAGAAYFLGSASRDLKEQGGVFPGVQAERELATLRAKAEEFNRLVATARDARTSTQSWYLFLARLKEVAATHGVTIDRLEVASLEGAVTLTGRVAKGNYDAIQSFTGVLTQEPSFSEVNLPIRQIANLDDGSLGFTITFVVKPDRLAR